MKRLRSSEDLDSYGENSGSKDWGKKDDGSGLSRSSSHRNYYYKADSGRKILSSSSSSRYDRLDDDRESSRFFRKRTDYDSESYDRRMSYDRYRDRESSYRGIVSSSPRGGYGGDRIQRSESFSGSRRDFPKGFRSERDRPRRDNSSSSWRRFGTGKDVDEGIRPACDSIRSSKVPSEDKGKLRIPQGVEEARSPAWSKDSGSERSKSVEVSKSIEVKKSEDFRAESGSSSEMEEGELEPEPDKEIKPEVANEGEPVNEGKSSVEPSHGHKELENGHNVEDTDVKVNKENVIEEKVERETLRTSEDLLEEGGKSPHSRSNSTPETSGNGDLTVNAAVDGDSRMEEMPGENQSTGDDERKNISADQEMPGKVEDKGNEVGDPEVNVGKEVSTALSVETEYITLNGKDKGKDVALSLSNAIDTASIGVKVEGGESVVICRDDLLEGSSFRGLELFARDPVRKPEKPSLSGFGKSKDEKLKFEPLDLSLSLPNVLLPISSLNVAHAPNSPTHERSVQSVPGTFCTNSDGLTMSMSFSGSMAFTHNPSCSLTHNSFDNYEQSVCSKPLFGGVDQVSPATWHCQPSNEQKHKELGMHEQALSNNGSRNFYHSQASASHSIPNDPSAPVPTRAAEGNSGVALGVDPQASLHRQLSGVHSRSPSQSVGSFEKRSEFSRNKMRSIREKDNGSLQRSGSQNGAEKFSIGGIDAVDPLITMIVSEPVHVIARKFDEMNEQSTACLKESVRVIISDAGKKWHLSSLQKALHRRSDITLGVLLKAHRTQLEILVALKTGLQEFLQRNYETSASDLAEVFLNLRCRNLTCRSLLPVDECDCKLCVEKDGFCSACMCLLCSKFDMASNTCSWVGCDVCLHWCHVDCALRGSYIRNGCSPQGTTEVQFHCVACSHPSEMFGFVKEVFQNFVRVWTAQTLSKELECVRKIFSASEDTRGKRLHNIAVLMLPRLANNCDLLEVQNQILSFLTDSDSFKSAATPIVSRKDPPDPGLNKESPWRQQQPSEKAPQLERRPSFTNDLNSSRKEPVFDELDSIVRIKQAEAKMFQSRADEARREAEGLKRIAMAKSERTEEEYKNRIAKLHLLEAEEIRKQKFEELQNLERAHREYYNMKLRMEADIKELWAKMEAAKRNI